MDMQMDWSMTVYAETPLADMQALDADRWHAEQFSVDSQVWDRLAVRYDGQGRSAQAANCRRRAAHYAGVMECSAVAVETLEVAYAGD